MAHRKAPKEGGKRSGLSEKSSSLGKVKSSKFEKYIKGKTRIALAEIRQHKEKETTKKHPRKRLSVEEKNRIIFSRRQKEYEKRFYKTLKKNSAGRNISDKFIKLYSRILATANHRMSRGGGSYINIIEDYKVSDIFNAHENFSKINPAAVKKIKVSTDFNEENNNYTMNIDLDMGSYSFLTIISFSREREKDSDEYVNLYRQFGDKKALEQELSRRITQGRSYLLATCRKIERSVAEFSLLNKTFKYWDKSIDRLLQYLHQNPHLAHTNTYTDKKLQKYIDDVKNERVNFFGILQSAYSREENMTVELFQKITANGKVFNLEYNRIAKIVGGQTKEFGEDIDRELENGA